MSSSNQTPNQTVTRYKVAASGELPEKGRLVADAGDKTVGVFRVDGRLYAYENTCPHQGGPVCQGMVTPAVKELLNDEQVIVGNDFDEADMRIVCPWHGFEFRIQTGVHPASEEYRLTAVEVEEVDGVIYVVC